MDAPYGANKKILLVVEDDRILAKNLSDFFRDAGFTVLQAGDGETGLEMAVKERPDIILLDIVLPKMDGLTMLKKLRQEHQALKVPVILLTNLEADDKITASIVNNEPSYYLVKKDWQLQDVLEKVLSTLEGIHS